MTVSTTNSTQTFSGGQSVLTFNFSALTAFPQYIQVSAIALTGGTVTALSYGTQYTVTISTTGVGGTVIVLPTFGSNYNYVVYRQTEITQASNYTNYNNFPAGTLMGNLDQLTMIDQEANTNVSLSLVYPIGTATTYKTTMPIPSIGTVLGTDPTGTMFVNLPPAPSGATGATGAVGPSGSTTTVTSSTSDITVTTSGTSYIISSVNAGTGGSNTLLRLNSVGAISAPVSVSTTCLTGLLGSWVAKSAATTYQAATDLFVIAFYSGGSSCEIDLLTDSNASPTTTRSTVSASNQNVWVFTPVKKNDYFRVNYGVNAPTIIYSIPLGT